MSMSTWRKVVIACHRIARGHVLGALLAGPSHFGAWIGELGSDQRHAVVAVGDEHVAELFPLFVGERQVLRARGTRRRAAVDVGTVIAEHLALPPALVRRADPDRAIDVAVDEPRGALVEERVLARPRAEALAEQHELRAIGSGRSARRRWRAEQEVAHVLATLCHLVERQHRRRAASTASATVAQSPAGQELERSDRGVVHVAGAGGGDHEQPLPVERADALELVDARARRAPRRSARCRGRRRRGSAVPALLAHHRADPLLRADGPGESTTLACQVVKSTRLSRLPDTSGFGGGTSKAASTEVPSSRWSRRPSRPAAASRPST